MGQRWLFVLALALFSLGLAAAQSAAELDAFLTLAAEGSPSEVEAALLAQPALRDVTDEYGQTPLMYAARFNDEFVVGTLIFAGADLNARSAAGWTALHYAVAFNSNSSVAMTLNDAGADITIRNQDGHTPLDLLPEDDIDTRAILEGAIGESTAISDPIIGTSIRLEDTVFCETHGCVFLGAQDVPHPVRAGEILFSQRSYRLDTSNSATIDVVRSDVASSGIAGLQTWIVIINVDGMGGELRPAISGFSQDLLKQFVGTDSPDVASVCDRGNLTEVPGAYLHVGKRTYQDFSVDCSWSYFDLFANRVLRNPDVSIQIGAVD